MGAKSVTCDISVYHQVWYTEMLSDGDSAAFREVAPNPGHEIVTLECINHAHTKTGPHTMIKSHMT